MQKICYFQLEVNMDSNHKDKPNEGVLDQIWSNILNEENNDKSKASKPTNDETVTNDLKCNELSISIHGEEQTELNQPDSFRNSIYGQLKINKSPFGPNLSKEQKEHFMNDQNEALQEDKNKHDRMDTNFSLLSEKTEFAEGDFVDLILRDLNNLVVGGVVIAYNAISKFADIRILPSREHNRGNDIERFVEAEDLRFKGLRINDLAVLRFCENDENDTKYPLGFELDFEALKKEELFKEEVIEQWQNNINKPSKFELFNGLKVRLKAINPSGMILVTILPSTRSSKYLLQQITLKVDIENIVALNEYNDDVQEMDDDKEQNIEKMDIIERAKKLKQELAKNGMIKDRKCNSKTYNQSFVGKEAISIIIKLKLIPISMTNKAGNEQNAIKFGMDLFEAKIIEHARRYLIGYIFKVKINQYGLISIFLSFEDSTHSIYIRRYR